MSRVLDARASGMGKKYMTGAKGQQGEEEGKNLAQWLIDALPCPSLRDPSEQSELASTPVLRRLGGTLNY